MNTPHFRGKKEYKITTTSLSNRPFFEFCFLNFEFPRNIFFKKNMFRGGFSILEVLLVVSIVGILAGLSAPSLRFLQVRNDLDVTMSVFVSLAREAQIKAQAVEGDSSWGVRANVGSIVLFKGSTFASRDQGFDIVVAIPENISISGSNEFVFSKFTGLPQTTGFIKMTSIQNNERTIDVNTKGVLQY